MGKSSFFKGIRCSLFEDASIKQITREVIKMLKNLFVQMTLKGWRRIDLAEKADVPAWQIVRCIKHPKLYKFKAEERLRITKALGVEESRIEWLFAETDEKFEKEAAHENVRTSTDI